MPLVQTRGAASAQGFGEFAQASAPVYVEEVLSTSVWTGTGAAQTITNNIDLSTKGGLIWIKKRSTTGTTGDFEHFLQDTTRGIGNTLTSNDTSASAANNIITAVSTTGFTSGIGGYNRTVDNFVAWTFRKQPKFFDIVTYTGNGSTSQSISHSLSSTPRFIVVKSTSTAATNWKVLAWDGTNYQLLYLNLTNAGANVGTLTSYVSSTSIDYGGISTNVESGFNTNGQTYVAYLFAHDAGGFGLTGTDNVISCGSFNNAVASEVTLGWEPQWLLVKSTSASNWHIIDTMRGMSNTGQNLLAPNLTNAEIPQSQFFIPTATGFTQNPFFGNTTIYIAIRRGPMKVPTTGTSVFSPIASSDTQGTQQTTGFPVDLQIAAYRPGNANNSTANDRLRGVSSTSTGNTNNPLVTSSTAAETAGGIGTQGWNNTGFAIPAFLSISSSIYWNFRRAPSFFDEVCYTGTGSTRTVTHNLGVTPELVITKSRSQALGWVVWTTSLTNTDYWIRLDDTMAQANSPVGYGGTFSASNYTIANTGPYNALNNSASTYVAYLFATCAGVSKVGSYTGTGTTKQIDCGFTAGARFVLIKKTSGTGSWYVWDSARGIVSGNDPYLLLNSTAAEVTNTDYIDTYSAGFEISSTAPSEINENGGSFIFLAIS